MDLIERYEAGRTYKSMRRAEERRLVAQGIGEILAGSEQLPVDDKIVGQLMPNKPHRRRQAGRAYHRAQIVHAVLVEPEPVALDTVANNAGVANSMMFTASVGRVLNTLVEMGVLESNTSLQNSGEPTTTYLVPSALSGE